jgi:amidohydrolase
VADILSRLLDGVEAEAPRATEDRRKLHAEPELGHQEHRTAALVEEMLPVEDVRRTADTGVIARVGPTGGPAVAIRAELDGLPLAEATGADFAAKNGMMHACGHDVHMAALAALVRAAASMERDLPLPLVAVFQPSEETYPSGAERIVEERILEDLAVRAALAVHVHPDVVWGRIAVDDGPVNASADNVRIVVEGTSGHAAYPHRTRDSVLALSHVVVALQQVVSRRLDPMHNAVLTIGWVHGGSSENVVAQRAEAGGTLRVLQHHERDALLEAIGELVADTARAHGCVGKIEITEGEPGLVNDTELVAAVRSVLPRAGFEPGDAMRSCGSDDFGYFGLVVPTVMAFLGLKGLEGGTDVPLHHPEFLPPDDAVVAVARAQAAMYAGSAALVSEAG